MYDVAGEPKGGDGENLNSELINPLLFLDSTSTEVTLSAAEALSSCPRCKPEVVASSFLQ